MKFNLMRPQYIVVKRRCLYFHHDAFHGVVLSRNQFFNLNDIIYHDLKTLKSYPLGQDTWITQRHDGIHLQTPSAYFLFYHKSWTKYIRNVHRRILSYLRHGEGENCEYDADDEDDWPHQSGRLAQGPRWKTASRSTRNARRTHFRWKKHSTVSERHNPNPRRRPSARCRYHVPRADAQNTHPTVSDEDLECGDECTVEDEAQSSQDTTQ